MSFKMRLFFLLAILVTAVSPWSLVAADVVEQEPVVTEAVRVSAGTQEETVEKAVVVATTDIRDAKIVHQNGHEVTVLFSLYNATGVQSGIVYGAELIARDGNNRKTVDVKVLTEKPITLGEGESLPVSVTYEAPEFLSGEYELWLVAKTLGGMPLSFAPVGAVAFASVGGHVELSQCAALVGGERYALAAGVDIASGEKLEISCQAVNTNATAMEISPQFSTYERSVYGLPVSAAATVAQSVTLQPKAAEEILFTVPTAQKAQAYDAVLELLDQNGAVVSVKTIIHYVVQGESATVQNVVFDRSAYAAGDTAEVLVSWSLAADSFSGARGAGTAVGPLSMSVLMADAAGEFCSSPTQLSLQGASLVSHLAVPVLRTCENPQLIVSLSNESGAQLAAQSLAFAPEVAAEELTAPATPITGLVMAFGILVLIVILFLAAVKLLSYARTRRISAPVHFYEPTGSSDVSPAYRTPLFGLAVSVMVGGGLLLSVAVTPVEAATLHVVSGFDTVTFTVNLNKSTYTVDEPINVSGAAFVLGCGNAIAAGGLEAKDGQGVMQTIGTFNMDPYSDPGGFAIFDRTIDGYSTPGDKLMPIRAYVENGASIASALGNLPLSVICPSGTEWNGTSCVSSSPEPAATISGVGCTIPVGESSCVASIDWHFENAVEPVVRNVTTNTIYSYATSGTGEQRTIGGGVNVVAAYNDTIALATTPVIGVCEEGSSWNGSICEAEADPSASITATSCDIPVGGASCGITMSWDIQSASAPNIYDETIGVTYASVSVGSDVPQTITYGSHTLQVRDGIMVLDSTIATAACIDGSVWDGAACVVAGDMSVDLTANGDDNTTYITEGDDVKLEWVVTGDSDECLATDDWSGTKTVTGGDEWQMDITSDRTFTLTCSGLAGSVSDTVAVVTNSLPNLVPAGLSLSPSTTFDPTTGVYDSVVVRYSIRNEGETEAGLFKNRLTLDRYADGSDDETITANTTDPILPGDDSPIASVTLASNVPFGTHRISIATDSLDDVEESDEGDNETSFTMNVPVPDVSLEITADPTLVRNGQSSTLHWDTQVTFPMDCVVMGPSVSHHFDPHVDGATGSRTVGPITAKSEFMLRCTEPTTGTVFTDTAEVRTVGTIEEI